MGLFNDLKDKIDETRAKLKKNSEMARRLRDELAEVCLSDPRWSLEMIRRNGCERYTLSRKTNINWKPVFEFEACEEYVWLRRCWRDYSIDTDATFKLTAYRELYRSALYLMHRFVVRFEM